MADKKHAGEPGAKKLTPDGMVAKAYADLEVDHDDIYELQAKIDRLEAEKAVLTKAKIESNKKILCLLAEKAELVEAVETAQQALDEQESEELAADWEVCYGCGKSLVNKGKREH